ncbi:MAG TPA: fused response regulator/phosphatase [Micromonosporaceae bacterium]|nr:fused response regulator/phosphatase [Micromonosporaceae bacterium]
MEPGAQRLSVLLVEDDGGDAFLVGELLHEVGAPFDMHVVPTVAEARPRLEAFDCTLLDLDLPDASGLSALREVLTHHPDAAVVVLTGTSDEHLGALAVAAGAQDYLVKGRVDGVLLERAVRYAVERRHAEDSALKLREANVQQAESARLERGLLPHPLVDDVPVNIYTFYRTGRAMGVLSGDFLDAVQTGPGRLSVLVGDVCGHGAEEAALGVELRVAWRALTLAGVHEEPLLRALDRVLVSERRDPEIFVTLAMAHIDVDAGRARVRTLGHPAPLLITGGRAAPMQVKPSMVMGLLPRDGNEPAEITLPDGGWGVLMFTDGLIDGRNGEDWLGSDGLSTLVNGYVAGGGALARLPEWLVAQAEQRNGGPLADDVAMLLVTGGIR